MSSWSIDDLNLDSLRVERDGSFEHLPKWAKSAIQLGAWARYLNDLIEGRLLVFCVVPCRDSFTALVGLGATAAGASLFEKGFTWEDLLGIAPGTEIFWSAPTVKQKLIGIIQPKEELGGQLLVPVTITSGPKKMKGANWLFSESKFRDCTFSEEKLPSTRGAERIDKAKSFFQELGILTNPSWLMTAGAEVRFFGNRSRFQRSVEGWRLATDDVDLSPVSVDELLCLKDEGDSSLAKSRFTNQRSVVGATCPVNVLDGPNTFHRLQEVSAGSLIVVLERDELAEEHLNLVTQASFEHSNDDEDKVAHLTPKVLDESIDVWAACLR